MKKIIPTEENLTEEYITANADIVDWEYVSRKMEMQNFSEEFFIKFKYDIKWKNVVYYNPSMTTELAHKYEKDIGSKFWYKKGKIHREDGPAEIWPNGKEGWYKNGLLHREDEPAIIWSGRTEGWYKKGKLHREDGPAIIRSDGTKFWYQNGEFIK